jgi:hypothetical protein
MERTIVISLYFKIVNSIYVYDFYSNDLNRLFKDKISWSNLLILKFNLDVNSIFS